MEKIINKFINIFYVLTIFLIYLVSFKSNIYVSLLFGIISLVGVFIIIKSDRKHHIISKILTKKYLIIFLIIVAVFLRLLLLLFEYNDVVSDEATFFYNAINLATGANINSKYISVFPYLFGYISILSFFMKIFGTTIYHAIFFNILIDLIGAFFAYLYGKKVFQSNQKGILFLLLWLFNPFNIVWCMKILPINIVNTMIMICIYVYEILLYKFNNYKYIVISILLGILIGMCNSVRPIMIIFLIAIVIHYIYLWLFQKYNIKKIILSILIVIICYICYNNLNYLLVKNMTGYIPAKNSSGWSIYIGSNYESSGMWFAEPKLNDFFIKEDDFSPTELNNYFLKEGIENYKEYNLIKLVKFMGKKFGALTYNVHSYTYSNTIGNISNQISYLDTFFKIYLYIFWFFVLIINIISIFIKQDEKKLIIYKIFFIGLVFSHLLVEVSPRYFMPMFVPLNILTFYLINNLLKNKGSFNII